MHSGVTTKAPRLVANTLPEAVAATPAPVSKKAAEPAIHAPAPSRA